MSTLSERAIAALVASANARDDEELRRFKEDSDLIRPQLADALEIDAWSFQLVGTEIDGERGYEADLGEGIRLFVRELGDRFFVANLIVQCPRCEAETFLIQQVKNLVTLGHGLATDVASPPYRVITHIHDCPADFHRQRQTRTVA